MASAIWTDKHNEFCLKHKLPASVRALWQWLLEEKQQGRSVIEFDLKDFNKWVTRKRGYPFDPKTLKYARDRLMNLPVVSYCKEFTWSIWRWTLRPINLLVDPVLKPLQKSSQFLGETPDKDAPNPQSVADGTQTTTTDPDEDLAAKVKACEQAGIRYMNGGANFLNGYTWKQVTKAIAFFFASGANNRDKVSNPEGWLRACLQDDYVGAQAERQRKDSSEYYSPGSPIARQQMGEWQARGSVLG